MSIQPICRITLPTILLLAVASQLPGQISHDENVPADMKAVIAVNVDMESLTKNKLLAEIFELSAAEDPDSLFGPGDITKISALIGAPTGIDEASLEQTNAYVYIAFKDESTTARIKQMMMDDGGKPVTIGGKTFIEPPTFMLPPGMIVDIQARYMVMGTKSYLSSPSNQFASKGLAAAYAGLPKAPVRVAIDFDGARKTLDQVSAMGKASADAFTKPYVSLIDEISSIAITSDIDNNSLLKVAFHGHDDKEGGKIKLKLDALIGLGKGFMENLPPGAMGAPGATEKIIMDAIQNVEAVQAGKTVVVELTKPAGFEEMVSQMVKEARKAARRFNDINNFRQALIAILNHESAFREFPFTKHCAGEDSGKGLSWIVYVLPFLEQQNLFESMDPKGDYDSPKNQAAAKIVIPTLQLKTGGQIRFIRPTKVPKSFRDLTDGSSNTACLIQSRKADMSPWTKAVSITPKEVLEEFKTLKDGEFMIVGMYDGSTHELTNKTDLSDVEAMLEPADGKIPENLFGDFEEQFLEGPAEDGFEDFSKKVESKDSPDRGLQKSEDDDPFGTPNKESTNKSEDPFKASNDDPFGK